MTFDRDMRVGSFDPSDIVSLIGPIGPVPGPFTVQAVPGSLRIFNILFATPQRLSGSYTVTISPNIYSVVNSDPTRTTGNPVDTNQNAGVGPAPQQQRPARSGPHDLHASTRR